MYVKLRVPTYCVECSIAINIDNKYSISTKCSISLKTPMYGYVYINTLS